MTFGSFSALQRAENSSIDAVGEGDGVGEGEFQCSSASRKFLNRCRSPGFAVRIGFQCSSASRKFLNHGLARRFLEQDRVSVLFSEPKIPQSAPPASPSTQRRGFSALQRAENSSMLTRTFPASRSSSFSALQRAENSSILDDLLVGRAGKEFQCSSASRKFLNAYRTRRNQEPESGFSALQRAENSSMVQNANPTTSNVTFQCSSASRKFLNV